MMPTFDDVLDAARALDPADRVRLADALWDDASPSAWPLPNEEWIAEAQRRSAAHDEGHMSAAALGRGAAPRSTHDAA